MKIMNQIIQRIEPVQFMIRRREHDSHCSIVSDPKWTQKAGNYCNCRFDYYENFFSPTKYVKLKFKGHHHILVKGRFYPQLNQLLDLGMNPKVELLEDDLTIRIIEGSFVAKSTYYEPFTLPLKL